MVETKTMKNECNVEKEKTHMTVKPLFKSLKSSERKYFIPQKEANMDCKSNELNWKDEENLPFESQWFSVIVDMPLL